MSFPTSSWKKANQSITKLSSNGMYVFTSVKRGKYKGRFFTAKAFKDLQSYFATKASSYEQGIARDIMKHITISGRM